MSLHAYLTRLTPAEINNVEHGRIRRFAPHICALFVAALPVVACGAPAEEMQEEPGDDTATAPVPAGKADGFTTCELSADPGPCEASENRWFYDPEEGSCQPFVYGGCEGNDNNFETAEACQEACGYEVPGLNPPENPSVCEERDDWSDREQTLIDKCMEAGRIKVVEQAEAYGCSLDPDDVVASGVDARFWNPSKYIWYLGCAQCSGGERVIQKTVQSSFGKCH